MRSAAFIAGIAAFAGAASAQLAGSGLVVLDPNAQGALTLSGGSSIQIPARAMYVNSSSASAVRTVGNATLDCPSMYVVGRCNFSGGSGCTGSVTENAAGYADPMIATAFPSAVGMQQLPAQDIRGGTVTLQPGYYAHGISASGNANITFAPGVFIIGGSGLSITSANITANGVSLVMVAGSLNLGGNGTMTLSPPASGSPAGIVIAQSSTNTSAMSLSGGNNLTIDGAIYVPNATLTLTGNSEVAGDGPQMGDLVVAKRVTLSGTGSLKIGHPLSTALQLPLLPFFD